MKRNYHQQSLRQQGDALLYNFALGYAIRSVQANQKSLKLNGTHQFLFYADDVNILGEIRHATTKQMSFLDASKENGLVKLSTWSCLEIRMQGEVTI